MYEDIYFLDVKEALKIASEQNRWGANDYYLQACYYDGEKIQSDLVNLIHLPIDNLLESLAYGIYRIPNKINFDGLILSDRIKSEIELNFNLSIGQVKMYRDQLNAQYLQTIKTIKQDFAEPLRFYLPASSSTVVMQYVSKNIADTLKGMGYDVYYNLYEGIEDTSCLKILSEYNPHVTININHLSNQYLNEDVFNFVWFQDYMPDIVNPDTVVLRKRDFVFSLLQEIDLYLIRKNIPFKRQSFCANENIFFEDKNIKKENKIVFIGRKMYLKSSTGDNYSQELENIVKEKLRKGEDVDKKTMFDLADKFGLDRNNVYGDYASAIIRDLALEWLCEVSPIPVEIYGNADWMENDIIKPFYKGSLEYGDEIRKIYNSAKYVIIPTAIYFRMNRMFESVSSGCIPVVYSSVKINDEPPYYDDDILYFNTKESLKDCFTQEYKGNPKNILKGNMYTDFTKKIIKTIDENK